MATIPTPIRKWIQNYVTESGSGDVASSVVQEVQTRSDIPEQNGVFYVTDEDTIVLRINK